MVFLRLLLMTSVVNLASCNFRILLLHTNDMHSRYKEVNQDTVRCQDPSSKTCYGGFARVRAAVKRYTEEAKKRGVPTLYLDAGDVFQETVYYTEFKSELAVKMMNLMAPVAMSLGNHEFDDGVSELSPFVRDVQVPLLCCNIDVSKEPRLQSPEHLKPSMVLRLGETRIGIVGYLTREIPPEKLGGAEILDEITSLKSETKRLREREKVHIIIALGHSGYKIDKEIAKNVEEIDVLVGGHSHTFLYTGTPPSSNKVSGDYPTMVKQASGKEVPIVHASYGTKYLGLIELEFNDNWKLISHEGQPVLLTGDMEQDEDILEVLKPYSEKIAVKYQRKIGYTEFLFKGRSAYCRFQECNIGNMITDAFVDYVNKNYKAPDGNPVAQIGLIHSGAIKASLSPKSEGYTGEIVLEDIMMVLPFACHLEVLELTGSVLRTVLESAMDTYDPKNGGLFKARLMQVSGLRLEYDLTKEKGTRLVSVTLASNEKLDNEALYRVVMPDYLAQGIDFPILANQKKVVEIDKDVRDYTVVAGYIEQYKIFKINGKYEKTESRISIKLKPETKVEAVKPETEIEVIKPETKAEEIKPESIVEAIKRHATRVIKKCKVMFKKYLKNC